MSTINGYDKVISSIYECLLSPERLTDALDSMTSFLDGDTCHLVGWDRATLEPVLSVSTGLPAHIGPEYAAHYIRIDPRLQLSLRMAPGASLACHKHFGPEFVSRSEFYQDYLLPYTGLHYLLGATDLVPDGQDLLAIGLHRHVGHKHFDDDEIEWFDRLKPHLGRVLTMLTTQHRSHHAQSIKGVADQLSHLAVFGLDDTGRLIEANEYATGLLRANDPLTLRHGKLKVADDDQDASLSALFRLTLKGRTTHLMLTNSARERRYCITLRPAPTEPRQMLTNRRLAVVVIACDTSAKRVATAAQLMEFYKLTSAEARLVRALCHGEDVQSYATAEDLKVTTVRSHLKAAMEKTETHNQRDLVRMVMAIPAVRS